MKTDERLAAGRELARAVLERFGFDFVGLSFVPSGDDPELVWDCAAGNTSNRYRRIVLPASVGVLGTVFSSGRPILVRDVSEDIEQTDLYQYPIVAAEGLRAFLAFPLLEEGRTAMILVCAVRERREMDEALLRDAQEFAAERAGLEVANREPLMPRKAGRGPILTEVTHKILQAQEAERKRVARELHDGLSQEILLAQIELRKLKYLPAERKDEGIEQACEKLREIMTHVSEIATGLRPAALDELGLATAISTCSASLQHSFGVEIAVKADPLEGADEDCECALYRIFQEAITNACKYSRAERIEVSLAQTDDDVELRVSDQGIGFDAASPEQRGGGLGIEGMRERAELVGGRVSIESAPGAGTVVAARIPLARRRSRKEEIA